MQFYFGFISLVKEAVSLFSLPVRSLFGSPSVSVSVCGCVHMLSVMMEDAAEPVSCYVERGH